MRIIKNRYNRIALILNSILVLFFPAIVFAGNVTLEKMKGVAETGGYASGVDEFSMAKMVGTVITSLLSLLGIVFVVLMIYGGFKWMKASGREDEVGKAQEVIKQAIIGLVITASSYSISLYVMSHLLY